MLSFIKHGLNKTPFGGLIFTIGRKGIVDCEKEWPEHLIIPEMLGKT